MALVHPEDAPAVQAAWQPQAPDGSDSFTIEFRAVPADGAVTWILVRALLGHAIDFDLTQTLLFGLLNSLVAVPLFLILDKLRERG